MGVHVCIAAVKKMFIWVIYLNKEKTDERFIKENALKKEKLIYDFLINVLKIQSGDLFLTYFELNSKLGVGLN